MKLSCSPWQNRAGTNALRVEGGGEKEEKTHNTQRHAVVGEQPGARREKATRSESGRGGFGVGGGGARVTTGHHRHALVHILNGLQLVDVHLCPLEHTGLYHLDGRLDDKARDPEASLLLAHGHHLLAHPNKPNGR